MLQLTAEKSAAFLDGYRLPSSCDAEEAPTAIWL